MWDIKRPEYDPVRLDDDISADIESRLQPQKIEHVGLTSGIDLNPKSRTQKRIRYAIASAVLLSLVLIGVTVAYKSSSQETYSPCVSPEKRMEWRDMNRTEQVDYIEAVKCLQQFPARLFNIGRLSDDFPWLHRHVAKESKCLCITNPRV